jgi:hypothetical protein
MIIVDFYRVEQPNGGYIEYTNLADIPEGAIYVVIQREVQTPEEIEAEQIIIKEENTDKDEYNLLIENGNALFLRHQTRLIRRVKKGSLTQARAKTVRTLLIETYTLMNMGLIELANDKANAIPTQTNNGIQNEIDWMRQRLTELLTNFNPLRTL